MHHDQDMSHMGGLRRAMPFTFWTFLIGAAALSALPLVTSGFYSKDLILEQAFAEGGAGIWLWAAGLLGAFLTSIYTFRMVFLVFFGQVRHEPVWQPGLRTTIPLGVLAILSVVGGFVDIPRTLGNVTVFSDFMHRVLPAPAHELPTATEGLLQVVAAVVSMAGIYVAYLLFLRSPRTVENISRTATGAAFGHLWRVGWGFDWLYDWVFVRPLVWFANTNRADFVDLIYRAVARMAWLLNRVLSASESGLLRWYAAGIAVGAVIVIAIGIRP
jgi:NADH-quinone oxidoreductase subunit L